MDLVSVQSGKRFKKLTKLCKLYNGNASSVNLVGYTVFESHVRVWPLKVNRFLEK